MLPNIPSIILNKSVYQFSLMTFSLIFIAIHKGNCISRRVAKWKMLVIISSFWSLQLTNHFFVDIASSSLDSTLCIFSSKDGKLLNQISLGPVDLWTVAFSSCSKFVISGSNDGKISMYNVLTGKQEQVLDPQNGKFTLSLAYSPDGKFIASGAIDGKY